MNIERLELRLAKNGWTVEAFDINYTDVGVWVIKSLDDLPGLLKEIREKVYG